MRLFALGNSLGAYGRFLWLPAHDRLAPCSFGIDDDGGTLFRLNQSPYETGDCLKNAASLGWVDLPDKSTILRLLKKLLNMLMLHEKISLKHVHSPLDLARTHVLTIEYTF